MYSISYSHSPLPKHDDADVCSIASASESSGSTPRIDDLEMVDGPVSKTGGVTPCQFDSDLRHHVYRHENAPESRCVSFWWGLRLVF